MGVQDREDEERWGDRWREARCKRGSKENKRQMECFCVCVCACLRFLCVSFMCMKAKIRERKDLK